jgi:hypothetical protein
MLNWKANDIFHLQSGNVLFDNFVNYCTVYCFGHIKLNTYTIWLVFLCFTKQ